MAFWVIKAEVVCLYVCLLLSLLLFVYLVFWSESCSSHVSALNGFYFFNTSKSRLWQNLEKKWCSFYVWPIILFGNLDNIVCKPFIDLPTLAAVSGVIGYWERRLGFKVAWSPMLRSGGLYGRILTEVVSKDRTHWGLYSRPRPPTRLIRCLLYGK